MKLYGAFGHENCETWNSSFCFRCEKWYFEIGFGPWIQIGVVSEFCEWFEVKTTFFVFSNSGILWPSIVSYIQLRKKKEKNIHDEMV